jgi:hypothetical protein
MRIGSVGGSNYTIMELGHDYTLCFMPEFHSYTIRRTTAPGCCLYPTEISISARTDFDNVVQAPADLGVDLALRNLPRKSAITARMTETMLTVMQLSVAVQRQLQPLQCLLGHRTSG